MAAATVGEDEDGGGGSEPMKKTAVVLPVASCAPSVVDRLGFCWWGDRLRRTSYLEPPASHPLYMAQRDGGPPAKRWTVRPRSGRGSRPRLVVGLIGREINPTATSKHGKPYIHCDIITPTELLLTYFRTSIANIQLIILCSGRTANICFVATTVGGGARQWLWEGGGWRRRGGRRGRGQLEGGGRGGEGGVSREEGRGSGVASLGEGRRG